jgi:hypothetical protein
MGGLVFAARGSLLRVLASVLVDASLARGYSIAGAQT